MSFAILFVKTITFINLSTTFAKSNCIDGVDYFAGAGGILKLFFKYTQNNLL
jgi:hypothetical protein